MSAVRLHCQDPDFSAKLNEGAAKLLPFLGGKGGGGWAAAGVDEDG